MAKAIPAIRTIVVRRCSWRRSSFRRVRTLPVMVVTTSASSTCNAAALARPALPRYASRMSEYVHLNLEQMGSETDSFTVDRYKQFVRRFPAHVEVVLD